MSAYISKPIHSVQLVASGTTITTTAHTIVAALSSECGMVQVYNGATSPIYLEAYNSDDTAILSMIVFPSPGNGNCAFQAPLGSKLKVRSVDNADISSGDLLVNVYG